MKKEKTEILKTIFKIKTQTILMIDISENFNGYHIIIKAEFIIVV